jgi:multicomponent Na+:H+ antiporter subunit F
MSLGVAIACGVMIAIGAACAVVRAERGPSMLDRVVAVDVVVATVLAAVAIVSAWTLRSDLVPVLVVLALVGFIGSVTVARFAAADKDDDKRILTREEAAAEREARRRAELEESDGGGRS